MEYIKICIAKPISPGCSSLLSLGTVYFITESENLAIEEAYCKLGHKKDSFDVRRYHSEKNMTDEDVVDVNHILNVLEIKALQKKNDIVNMNRMIEWVNKNCHYKYNEEKYRHIS